MKIIEHKEDYRLQRAKEYPSVGDQLDAIYKAFVLGDKSELEAIGAKITKIKQRFPKNA